MIRLMLVSSLSVLTLAACSQVVEDTRPGQPVKQRQEAFKAMLRSFEPMGTMLRTNQYQPDAFSQLANELISRRDAPWGHFGPDTLYPPSKAKAAVWDRAEAFERERQVFFERTDALLVAAQTRDQAQVQAAYAKVYDSCKSCHDDFKTK